MPNRGPPIMMFLLFFVLGGQLHREQSKAFGFIDALGDKEQK